MGWGGPGCGAENRQPPHLLRASKDRAGRAGAQDKAQGNESRLSAIAGGKFLLVRTPLGWPGSPPRLGRDLRGSPALHEGLG